MRPYQEEYIANLQEIAALTLGRRPEDGTLADYLDRQEREEARQLALVDRNMELLRGELFPLLDHLPDADGETLEELGRFASPLLKELDADLFCLIHQALLSLARQRRDRDGVIRELYWLGIGRHARSGQLVGLEVEVLESVFSQIRLCFAEAAAYLKYFGEIENPDTRNYILRSLANRSLGQFKSVSARVRLLKNALEVFQDPFYRSMDPEIPWDRFVMQTHRLMASSITYSRESTMTSQDVADIMESVYIVYDEQLRAAAEGKRTALRPVFHYHAIAYYCGLDSLNGLMGKVELLIDGADSGDFSLEGMYAAISLPAFYCQYLQQYPELLQGREAYVEELYRRVLAYMEAFPAGAENSTLFLYLCQLSYTFVETARSVPYGVFLERLLIRFAPEIYLHSRTVTEAAEVFSEILLAEEPGFFDDIDDIRVIADPAEKRREVLRFARGCGMFHDVGRLNLTGLYAHTGRHWLEEEYELSRLHTVSGEAMLAARPSTRRYASAALGHHAWYGGGERSYPDSYQRLACPERQMVDIISLLDWLENIVYSSHLFMGTAQTFCQAAENAVFLEGRRFSPVLIERLRIPETAEQLRLALERGRRLALERMYTGAGAAVQGE